MDVVESARPSAFSTLVATLIAPEEAFAAIRERTPWRLALTVTIVLAALGGILGTPATRHVIEATYAAQGTLDAREVAFAESMATYAWAFELIAVPIVILLEAAVIFGIRSVIGGSATFAQIFSLTTHVQVISLGIASAIVGIVVAMHPAASYRTQADFIGAIPTGGWLVPGASGKLLLVLSSLNPFSIWATVILALGLTPVASFRPATAWGTAIALLLFGAFWAGAFAR